MKVLCDEHVPEAVAAALRSEGIDAVRVGAELDLGTGDADLLEHAAENGYVVLTNDGAFVDAADHAGVLYYDDQRVPTRELVRAIRNVDDLLADETSSTRRSSSPTGGSDLERAPHPTARRTPRRASAGPPGGAGGR